MRRLYQVYVSRIRKVLQLGLNQLLSREKRFEKESTCAWSSSRTDKKIYAGGDLQDDAIRRRNPSVEESQRHPPLNVRVKITLSKADLHVKLEFFWWSNKTSMRNWLSECTRPGWDKNNRHLKEDCNIWPKISAAVKRGIMKYQSFTVTTNTYTQTYVYTHPPQAHTHVHTLAHIHMHMQTHVICV